MIQIIGNFLREKGYLLGRGLGALIIIISILFHCTRGSYYSYYDTKHHKMREVSIYFNYVCGAFIILANRKTRVK